MKVWTDAHGPQEMAPSDFSDPLTCPLAPPSGQKFYLSNTLVYDQIPAKLMPFLSASVVRCVVLISKCYADTLN